MESNGINSLKEIISISFGFMNRLNVTGRPKSWFWKP